MAARRPGCRFVRSMKAVKLNSFTRPALAALFVVFFVAGSARAQEEEGVAVVLDEPVVQVNNDVIMMSSLKRQLKDFKDALKQRGVSDQEAEVEISKRQPEIIFNLISEALLMQQGKEISNMPEQVEAEVNREMLRVCRAQQLNTLERCEEAMRAEGIMPEEIRQTLRSQFMRQAVLQREVDAKIYYSFTEPELRKYYEANRAKFQSVTLSEIYLSTAGRKPEDVRAQAAQIVAKARGGADFGELAAANSEREENGQRTAPKTKGRLEGQDGKLRWFLLTDLSNINPKFAEGVKPVQAGGVSDPVQLDEGFIIFKVHERDEAYNENQVRGEMLSERSEKERENYIRGLRQDAYIKPADNYKEIIQPLLDRDRATTASKDAGKDAKKPEKQ